MSWQSKAPQDTWSEKDPRALYQFLREIHTRLKFGSFTWNPPNVPAASTVDTTLTVSDGVDLAGLRVGQPVYVTPPSTLNAGLTAGPAWVAADNTLTVRLANVTAADINPVSGTWAFAGKVL